MNLSLFNKTPSVTVVDNRGRTVRDIAYHRHPETPTVCDQRTTRYRHDPRGFLTRGSDPRLQEAGLNNFTHVTDLSGRNVRTQSVDAGTLLALHDVAGRPLLTINDIRTDALGEDDLTEAVTLTFKYDPAGRLGAVTEQVSAGQQRITERLLYAGNDEAARHLNVAGRCIRHYDTAGLQATGSVALTGTALSIGRRLLNDAQNPDVVADWQGDDSQDWDELLAGQTYTTQTQADATGAVLARIDAAGNMQRMRHDVAGQLSGSWLTVKNGQEQIIVTSLAYSAAGQKLREAHGNGVVTTYAYEPRTQRLLAIRTERPAGTFNQMLQSLRYAYDPVGNVLSITNDSQRARFWYNQKVVPERTFGYDSLYQLAWATGREMAGRGRQGVTLPPVTVPIPADSSAYTSYTRTYRYDQAGNLHRIRHASATGAGYTLDVTVSDRSNRSVMSELSADPATVDLLFKAGGQQRLLQAGQLLAWTARKALWRVAPVVREGDVDDAESYRYDSTGQRISKLSVQRSSGGVRAKRTLYLEGLELQDWSSDEQPTQSLQVMTMGEAGRAQVRALHWSLGKPGAINNDQVCYSYDDLLGSSTLELDGDGQVISCEEYYPFGGTAILAGRSDVEASYKTLRYSGKERDATGLYYYGHRYYQAWVGRWLSADPAGTVEGLNLYRMAMNNPVTFSDADGRWTDLTTAFKQGDIVYGLDGPRKQALLALEAAGFEKMHKDKWGSLLKGVFARKPKKANIRIQNDITNAVWDFASPTVYSSDESIRKTLHDAPRAIAFRAFVAKHAKYNVKDQPEAGKLSSSSDLDTTQKLATQLWTRTSKAGLEFQLLVRKQPVHFIADDIVDTINEVASKTKRGNSITSSELRWLYRHRHLPEVQQNLFFYLDGKQVTHKEIFGKAEWKHYMPKRMQGSTRHSAR